MISALGNLLLAIILPLGLTLIFWSFGLVVSRQEDGNFNHFFMMYVGWTILVVLWMLMEMFQ